MQTIQSLEQDLEKLKIFINQSQENPIQNSDQLKEIIQALCKKKPSLKIQIQPKLAKNCVQCQKICSKECYLQCKHWIHKTCLEELCNSNLISQKESVECPDCKQEITLNVQRYIFDDANHLKKMSITIQKKSKEVIEKQKIEDFNKQECAVCFDVEDKLELNCNHFVCKGCLLSVIQQELENGRWRIPCPECNQPINHAQIQKILKQQGTDGKDLLKLMKFEFNEIIIGENQDEDKERIYKCKGYKGRNQNGELVKLKQEQIRSIVIDLKNKNFEEELVECDYLFCLDQKYTQKNDHVRCRVCNYYYCFKGCNVDHPGETCEKYEERIRLEREEELKKKIALIQQQEQQDLQAQMERLGLKQCGSCKNYIEKSSGCNRVTCRCGKSVCWKCLEVFDTQNLCYAHLTQKHGGYG